MDNRTRRGNSNLYSKEQIKRVLTGAGITIESEVDSDYIIFCPFHSNHRTPAGEVDKASGFFYCFSCQKIADLTELIMHTSARSYFESARYIKEKEQNIDLPQQIDRQLYVKPDFVQFDELLIKRLNNNAVESPRASRYYYGRLITDASISKFMLGFSEKQDMVTIPVHSPEGMCIGFVGRWSDENGDEEFQIPDTAKEIIEKIPADLDDMFCLSENRAELEEEEAYDSEDK